ncbi:thiamine pyrophosphate-dependent enzyme, partial [Desulfosarcina sp.]|uniref:thiamine pyrophosphate-dependent enzyme n=1 Tax=Desulfosarcina sp. TaxID=2027861 RepID=UPI003970CE5C
PDRRVINFQADGSAAYTLQSLWTQARENLNITTLLCANRRYRILEREVARAGNASPGEHTRALMDLSRPAIDWAALGRSMGVPAIRVQTAEDLAKGLSAALGEQGPFLIELNLAGAS